MIDLFKAAFEIYENDFNAIQLYIAKQSKRTYDITEIKKLYESYLIGLKQKQAGAERKKQI